MEMGDYEESVARIVVLKQAEAARQVDGNRRVAPPAPPATPDAILACQASLTQPIHPSYLEFLALHDGWEGFSWGIDLLSAEQLADPVFTDAVCEVFEDVDDLDPELAEGVVIGISTYDAARLLLLPDGAVVHWLYEEDARHSSLLELFHWNERILSQFADAAATEHARVEQEWTAEYRDAQNRALAAELSQRLRQAAQPEPASLLVLPESPGEVGELVARDGSSMIAEVGLGFVLYLGAAPTAAEVLSVVASLKRQVEGLTGLEFARAGGSSLLAEAATDEAMAAALRLDDEGNFGLRLQGSVVGASGSGRMFCTARAVPPTTDDQGKPAHRASFVELFLPASVEPEVLARIVEDLAHLPIRSGHAGWFAYSWAEAGDVHVRTWCRRLWGVEPVEVDGWVAGCLTRARGAGWLTVLGPAVVEALDGVDRLAGLPAGVVRTDVGQTAVLRAGAVPVLCDVGRGEWSAELAGVAAVLEPVMVEGFGSVGELAIAGNHFRTYSEELRVFAPELLTAAHLRRFVDPDRFAGPSLRERAEALLLDLSEARHAEWRDGGGTLNLLFHHLTAAAAEAPSTPSALAAGRLLVTLPVWRVPEAAPNNLLAMLLQRGLLEEATQVVPIALGWASGNPAIYHNAACVYALGGRTDEALQCAALAKEHGYDKLDSMRVDPDLALIAHQPEFVRLFDETE
jgi:hypothetical protein